jgi:hypothetical protein
MSFVAGVLEQRFRERPKAQTLQHPASPSQKVSAAELRSDIFLDLL